MKDPKLRPTETNHQKCKVIEITDLHLHTNSNRPTLSVGKKFEESFETHAPGRFHNSFKKHEVEEKTGAFSFEIDLGPDFRRMVEEEKAKGYKVIFKLPEGGAPVFLGKDAEEFMVSKKGKRILRRLDKENNKN